MRRRPGPAASSTCRDRRPRRDDVVLGEPGAAAARISAPRDAALPDRRRQRGHDRGHRHRRLPGDLHGGRPAADRRLHRHPDPRPRDRPAHGPARHAFQIGFDCGFGAEACYYSGENKIVLSGDESRAPKAPAATSSSPTSTATTSPSTAKCRPPFPAAIDWGTGALVQLRARLPGPALRRALPGQRGHPLLRGSGRGLRRVLRPLPLPRSPVAWRWIPGPEADRRRLRSDPRRHPRPLAGAHALQAARTRAGQGGRARPSSPSARRSTARSACAPREPRPATNWPAQPGRQVLRSSRHGLGFHHRLDYTVCGQSRLRVAVRSIRRREAFKLKSSDPDPPASLPQAWPDALALAAGLAPQGPSKILGGVAQLVRAPACHAGGRGFESRRSRLAGTRIVCGFPAEREYRRQGHSRFGYHVWVPSAS